MRTTLLLAAAAFLTASTTLANREVVHEFRSSAPAGAVRTVVIDVPVAEMVIRNGNSSTISVEGDARREYDDKGERESRQRSVDDASVDLEVRGAVAQIKRKFGPQAGGWGSSHIKFTVTVELPAGVNIDVRQKIGELRVDGSYGKIDVAMKIGEVRLRTPRANVRELSASTTVGEVHADTGDRSLAREGIFAGATRWRNESGKSSVTIELSIGEIHVQLTR